ncbi:MULTISPECIES: hypothetical protein [Streptomyces]|uniref:Serine/threonine protein kinase n=1 Tax=Streptomyces ramulosus TaxID=47762 RepID=A0ABW1FTZ1_9ACTN
MALALAAVGAGGWLIAVGARTTAPQRPPAAQGSGGPAAPAAARDAAPPVRFRIPAAEAAGPPAGPGHDTRDALRTLPAHRPVTTGRYRDGVPPGCPGTAVALWRAAAGPAALPPRGSAEVCRADGPGALLAAGAAGPRERDAVLGDFPQGPAARPGIYRLTCGDAERGGMSAPPVGTG